MRNQSVGLAECQALHLLAVSRAEQQNLRRQGAILANQTIWQPGRGPIAALPQLPSDARRSRWGHFTDDCTHASAKPRRSLRRPARSLSCSIIPCVMLWNTAIREPPITRNVIAGVSSPILNAAQSRWGTSYSQRPCPRECFLGRSDILVSSAERWRMTLLVEPIKSCAQNTH